MKSLRSLIYTLPSQYDLLWSQGMFPITYYYKSTYTSGSSASHDRNSRPVILMNLTEMLEFMCTWKRRFKEAVHERNRPEYERLYGWTLSAFYDWMVVARPRIRPPFSAYRAREQEGRASQKSRRLMTLLAHMKDL